MYIYFVTLTMLNYKPIYLFVAFLSLLMLQGCGSSKTGFSQGVIQKRRYSNGWHINLPEGYKKNRSQVLQSDVLAAVNVEPEVIFATDTLTEPEKSEAIQNYWTKSPCELIVRTDGVVYEVDSMRIERDSIYFQSCNRPQVRTGALPLNRVAATRDKTGCVEEINELNKYELKYDPDHIRNIKTLKRAHPTARIATWIFIGQYIFMRGGLFLGVFFGLPGLLVYLILSFLSIILLIVLQANAIKAIRNDNCRYRFKFWSWFILFYEIGLILISLILILMLFFFF